jgi:hypothetical protein
MLSELPPLDAAHRDAFRSLFDDRACERLGAQVRATATIAAVLDWSARIARTLRARAVDGYPPVRFAWLVECGVALAEARQGADDKADGLLDLQAQRRRAIKEARAARTELLGRLKSIAGHHETRRAAILALPPASHLAVPLHDALASAIQLAHEWLASDDRSLHILCDSVRFGPAALVRPQKATEALLALIVELTAAGRASKKDTVGVNRVEGRVIAEMRVARAAFDAAKDKTVPHLRTPPAMRHVFGRQRKQRAPAKSLADPVTLGAATAKTTGQLAKTTERAPRVEERAGRTSATRAKTTSVAPGKQRRAPGRR